MSRHQILAFVDESGQRSPSAASSDYFVMSAVLMQGIHRPAAEQKLLELKAMTNRKPEHTLHFTRLKPHHRVTIARELGQFATVQILNVVACKRILAGRATWRLVDPEGVQRDVTFYPPLSEDEAYLKSYQYLLERISWLTDSVNGEASIVIEHTKRFKAKTLRQFERDLREDSSSSVKWGAIGGPAVLHSKKTEPLLQFADATASAVGAAFNGHPQSGTTTQFVDLLKPVIWRGPRGNKPTTYGLKMHPWSPEVRQEHPWLESF